MGSDDVGDASLIYGPAWERTALLVVPPSDVNEVHKLVDDLWELNADLGDVERLRFETALVELAGNVIEHAYEGERLLCNLTLRRTSAALEAILSDTGPEVRVPFRAVMPDPEALGESGRGIAIIEMLMDDFSYERDSNGNQWCLVMRLPEALQREHHVAAGGDSSS